MPVCTGGNSEQGQGHVCAQHAEEPGHAAAEERTWHTCQATGAAVLACLHSSMHHNQVPSSFQLSAPARPRSKSAVLLPLCHPVSRPFVTETTAETRRIAELLSELPAEVDAEGLINRLLIAKYMQQPAGKCLHAATRGAVACNVGWPQAVHSFPQVRVAPPVVKHRQKTCTTPHVR